jgi:hypothetical protein
MPKGRTKFTENLTKAIKSLINDGKLGLEETRSRSLFSPVFSSDYKWVKVMDSDGLLVGQRLVKDGEGGKPNEQVYLRIGVVIQSEDSTSQTKPNPFGKAAIGTVRNGMWVDLKVGGRVRLDRTYVLFVLPKGAPAHEKKHFETAKRNVKNAADAMPVAKFIEFNRGISAENLKTGIRENTRSWLNARGRPAGPKAK